MQKDVYPYDYMDDCKKFNETLLLEKEDFYSHLNMEDIADAEYTPRFAMFKAIHYCYQMYLDTSKMCLEIYELDPARFLTAPGLARQTALKKTEVKLDLLTDIYMLLMVEKGVRGGICHSIHRYAKANDKNIKDYNKNKESSYLKYWDVNNLNGPAMSQKLLAKDFKWVENISEFNEDFMKSYNDKINKGYFLEVDVHYPENLHSRQNHLTFLPERLKSEEVKKLVTNLHDKNEYVIHIRNLKQELNHRLILKNLHKIIKSNQKALLKSYTDIRKKTI